MNSDYEIVQSRRVIPYRALKKNVKKKMRKLNTPSDHEVHDRSATFDSQSENVYLNEVNWFLFFIKKFESG